MFLIFIFELIFLLLTILLQSGEAFAFVIFLAVMDTL